MAKPYLSLIIPAYNEETRLQKSLDKLADFVDGQKWPIEVLVVENGSTDRTFAIAKAFSAKHKAFKVLQIEGKGKGLAVREGMLAVQGEYRMMLDADLSMPVDQIPRFIPPQIEGKEVVIASREAPGAVRYNEPHYRHIGGRIINGLIRLLALPNVHDSQCGFKCFHEAVAMDLFKVQQMDGWSFDVEILYIAKLRGYSLEELAIPWYYNEQSHVNPISDSLRMISDLLTIRANARKGIYGRKN